MFVPLVLLPSPLCDYNCEQNGSCEVSLRSYKFPFSPSLMFNFIFQPARELRAESARAVTGRRCPHSGEGDDFLTGQLNFFTKTAVTTERKVEKSIPKWEINRHAEGYKWVIDQNWGRMAKIRFFGQKPKFWAQKKESLFDRNHVLATTGKSCSKKKSAFAQIIKGENVILGDFLG